MFRAKAGNADNAAAQPITAAPTLIRHPSRIGNLVVFGTGKFFETEDKEGVKTHAQSVYGIWDTKTRAEPTSEITIGRKDLVEQTITQEVTGTYTQGGTNPARVISNNPVEWTATDKDGNVTITHPGWHLDLTVGANNFEGEMVIERYRPLVRRYSSRPWYPMTIHARMVLAIGPMPSTPSPVERHYSMRSICAVSDTGAVSIVSGIKQDGEGGITITQNPDGTYEACTGLDCEKVFPDPAVLVAKPGE